MGAVNIFNPANTIDVTDITSVNTQENERLKHVLDLFNAGVKEVRELIETTNSIAVIKSSMGKDSTVTLLMVIEAYRQSIAENKIEKERPLLVSTVNTLGEIFAMNMFVAYCRKRLLKYGKDAGINISHEIVTPTLQDEFFVKYAGAQKFVSNSTRAGDCTIQLKLNPSENYVKKTLHGFKTGGSKYANYNVISYVGSRFGEGNRRTKNINKSSLSRNINELIADLDEVKVGTYKMQSFAPIKHITTDEVFDLLRIAGNKPLKRIKGMSAPYIPAFLEDFGLLIELYGNGAGSKETCDISIGQTTNTACNGKSRFGCTFCTICGDKDETSISLSKLPRWEVLGSENTLRVRDWLYRISTDVSCRAFHARSHDPLVMRAALQPNTAKPQVLEKMVRFASQLTIDSINHAKEFKKLCDQGRELEHPGYKDIHDDQFMTPKVKRAFLEMYKESVQNPATLNTLFGLKHAILLSFRWSIDGVGGARFRPLAIWKQIERGEGRIPYPKLNSEYEAIHGKIKLTGNAPLPEAVMFPLTANENLEHLALNPFNLMDFWTRPVDHTDVFDEDFNCSVSRHADTYANIEASVRYNYSISKINNECIVDYKTPEIAYIKLDGKVLNGLAKNKLLTKGFYREIESNFYSRFDAVRTENDDATVIEGIMNKVFSQPVKVSNSVPYLQSQSLFCGYSAKSKAAEPAKNFTRRTTKVKKGKFVRGNTRLRFYSNQLNSRLHNAHAQNKTLLLPNYETHTQKFIGAHDKTHFTGDIENLQIDDAALTNWIELGGIKEALQLHDNDIIETIKKRHLRKYRPHHVRRYKGTRPAELLLERGVISVDKGYFEQLKFILKRTQIFNEMGLFQFQSMKLSEVANHPKAISMTQHRQDKANMLQIVRKHRNAQRKAVTRGFTQSIEDSATSNLTVLFKHAIESIKVAVHVKNMEYFKLKFNTSNVPALDRANTSSIWLALTFGNVSSIDDVLCQIMTQQQLISLKGCPRSYIKLSKKVADSLRELSFEIEDALGQWSELISILENKSEVTDFKCAIKKYAPPGSLVDDLLSSWKPGIKYFNEYKANAVADIKQVKSELVELKTQLRRIGHTSLKKMGSKMTLSDKLTVLNNMVKN